MRAGWQVIRRFYLLRWWRIDPDELLTQIERYNSFPMMRSVRGLSVLLIVFYIAVVLAIPPYHFSLRGSLDIAVGGVLAIFIYLGHRWASIAAMVCWTYVGLLWVFSSLVLLWYFFNLVAVSDPIFRAYMLGHYFLGILAGVGMLAFSLICWTSYMQIFLMAFRVESARLKPPAAARVFD